MADFIVDKNKFDIHKLSMELDEYCKKNDIDYGRFLKIVLVMEEYLSNILFPNIDGSVEISVSKTVQDIKVAFSYVGGDFMNKITDTSFLSLKILQKRTKSVKTEENNGKTLVEFLI